MKNLFTIALLALFWPAYAQEGITLDNPSFEDMPQYGRSPSGWESCGPREESPPDIHPNGTFGIERPAWEGQTYVGMVVRDNNTWEGISQFLPVPLLQSQCYALSFYACRAESLISLSRSKNEVADYNTPAVLRIWGGNTECPEGQLLAETLPIDNIGWAKFTVEFLPEKNWDYIKLEAYYDNSLANPYNGNILLDNFSAFSTCEGKPLRPIVIVDMLDTTHVIKEKKTPEFWIPEDEEALAKYLNAQSRTLIVHPGFVNVNALDNIVQVLYAFPGKRLIIEVNEPIPARKEQILLGLRSYYQEQEYDPDMIRFGVYTSHSRLLNDWLWDAAQRKIMMRLEER